MRAYRWIAFGLTTSLLLGVLACWTQASRGQAPAARPTVVWEYKTAYWGGGDPEPTLNGLGKQGWELVAARGYGHENQSQTIYIFKRAKP